MMRRNYCQNLILKWIHMWWLFDVLNQLGAQKYFYHLLCSQIYSDVLNLAIILYPDFSFAWISIQIHVNFTWIQNVIHYRFFFGKCSEETPGICHYLDGPLYIQFSLKKTWMCHLAPSAGRGFARFMLLPCPEM